MKAVALLLAGIVIVSGCAAQRGDSLNTRMREAGPPLVAQLEALPDAGRVEAEVSTFLTTFGYVGFTSILPAGATLEQAEDIAMRAERLIWTSQLPAFGGITVDVLAEGSPLVQRSFVSTEQMQAWFEPRYGLRPPGTTPGLPGAINS